MNTLRYILYVTNAQFARYNTTFHFIISQPHTLKCQLLTSRRGQQTGELFQYLDGKSELIALYCKHETKILL